MHTQETHTTHTQESARVWREPETDALVTLYVQACDELAEAQDRRDTLRASVLEFLRTRRADALTNGEHTVTRVLADVRAFDVETLRALVPSDTFASVTRVSVEPKAWDKARKTGAITDDTASEVVSVARTDERLTVRACDTAREFTPSPF